MFDFHLAKFLHNKVDCVKIDRWVDFEHNGLLEGSDLKDEIKEEDLKGCIDALWFHPEAKYKNTNLDHVILYFHGKLKRSTIDHTLAQSYGSKVEDTQYNSTTTLCTIL